MLSAGTLVAGVVAGLAATEYEMRHVPTHSSQPPDAPKTTFNGTRSMKLTGLTRGKDYYVRVRAVAAGQNHGLRPVERHGDGDVR